MGVTLYGKNICAVLLPFLVDIIFVKTIMILLYDTFDEIKCCSFKLLSECSKAKTVYGNTLHVALIKKGMIEAGDSLFKLSYNRSK